MNKSAAEHPRLPRGRIVKHAGLAGRYALLARDEFDFIAAISRAQPRRLRRAGRSHANENLQPVADRAVERAVANPVDSRNMMRSIRNASRGPTTTRRLAASNRTTYSGALEAMPNPRRWPTVK